MKFNFLSHTHTHKHFWWSFLLIFFGSLIWYLFIINFLPIFGKNAFAEEPFFSIIIDFPFHAPFLFSDEWRMTTIFFFFNYLNVRENKVWWRCGKSFRFVLSSTFKIHLFNHHYHRVDDEYLNGVSGRKILFQYHQIFFFNHFFPSFLLCTKSEFNLRTGDENSGNIRSQAARLSLIFSPDLFLNFA